MANDVPEIMGIEVPIGDSPWGTCLGMFRDKFGIEWMVDFNPKFNG